MLLLDFFSPPLPSAPAPASSAFRFVPAPPAAVLTDTSVDLPAGPPAASFATCTSAALQSAAPSVIAYLRRPQQSAIYVRRTYPPYSDAGERSSEAAHPPEPRTTDAVAPHSETVRGEQAKPAEPTPGCGAPHEKNQTLQGRECQERTHTPPSPTAQCAGLTAWRHLCEAKQKQR
ncbi:hypothetical protein C8Q78DRAFT_321947 [Trametes maxima]|nr:hypothetical protein C8Q78DRAFT_321947 [Trametes maxima]